MATLPTTDPLDGLAVQNVVHMFFRLWDQRATEAVAAPLETR